MNDECQFCNPNEEQILKTGKFARILIPARLHVNPEDGGHLIVIPIRHVTNRLYLSEDEAIEMWRFSIICSQLLKHTLGTEWYNFQENGNWMVNSPAKNHLHLHIYGRLVASKSQPFGEALKFPLKTEFKNWDFGHYTPQMINTFHEYIDKV